MRLPVAELLMNASMSRSTARARSRCPMALSAVQSHPRDAEAEWSAKYAMMSGSYSGRYSSITRVAWATASDSRPATTHDPDDAWCPPISSTGSPADSPIASS